MTLELEQQVDPAVRVSPRSVTVLAAVVLVFFLSPLGQASIAWQVD